MARTLRRGNRGTDVAQLQTDLNRFLSPIPLLTVDGDFGRNTENAVRAFQRREGLTVDGIAGSKTQAALQRNALNTGGGGTTYDGGMCYPDGTMDPLTPGSDTTPIVTDGLTSEIAELAVQIALTQTHVREVPELSNDGPDIQKYARAANKNTPILWCMVFVYWAFSEAATRLGKTHPMIGVPNEHTAYVTGVYAWAKNNNKTKSDPIRGDVFCVRGGSDGRTHRHTGIVTQVEGSMVKTIEGNTNNDGSDNGIGVFTNTRSTGRLDFFRLP